MLFAVRKRWQIKCFYVSIKNARAFATNHFGGIALLTRRLRDTKSAGQEYLPHLHYGRGRRRTWRDG